MAFIYLDNNATTQIDPRVVEAMLPYLRDHYANPSSVHHFGQQVRHAVESAREQIATAINAKPRQIIFTGGGSEANNLAILGLLETRPDKKKIITSAVEHDSVLNLTKHLATQGYRVTTLGVDEQGQLDLNELTESLDDDTALVSIMHANNETGVRFPLEEIAAIAESKHIPLHTDATQTVGKIAVDVNTLSVAMMTFAPHKFHGPKGVGCLYLHRKTRINSLIHGGLQERSLRAGTENVAGIVGAAEALHLAVDHLEEENTRVRDLRDRLEKGIVERVPCAHVIASHADRIPNTTNIGFEGLEAEALLMLMSNENLCASSGSACSSGSLEPSHVLEAMNIKETIAHGAIRFSLSRFTTDKDIESALTLIPQVVQRLEASRPRSATP